MVSSTKQKNLPKSARNGRMMLLSFLIVYTFASTFFLSPLEQNRINEQVYNWVRPTDPIRRWGCQSIMETPLVFVHIGKAGGGSIRIRFAAAAQNVNRSKNEWHATDRDNHSYPISGGQGAKLCNSNWKHHRIVKTSPYMYLGSTFEGMQPCNATTPLGQMVACPEPLPRCQRCDLDMDQCLNVYLGHNLLGSEIHWLPPKMLQHWWERKWANNPKFFDGGFAESFSNDLLLLSPDNRSWCPTLKKTRPKKRKERIAAMKKMKDCSEVLSSRIDAQFNYAWRRHSNQLLSYEQNYSPIYASLPVHRVTMLREPFSWLLSKFFWQKQNEIDTCDDIVSASRSEGEKIGWAHESALNYVLYLCGVDCISRFEHGVLTINELEAQAEDNLRQSFTVVGLSNETEQFYDMLDDRFGYFNSKLNPHFEGNTHTSRIEDNADEYDRCKKIYSSNETFRESLKQQSPVLAVLERLFQVAVEVNKFQQHELDECSKSGAEEKS